MGILDNIREKIISGKASETRELVQRAVSDGVSPDEIISVMHSAMDEVGRRFSANEIFLPEMMVAAHCVHVSPEDIELLAEFEVGVSHNPVSNLKLASGVSPVPAMLEGGVKLGLGTDGAASNNTLDLMRDMQLTALLHKVNSGDPSLISFW